MLMVTKEEMEGWERHPATLALREVLQVWKRGLVEQWEAKVFQQRSPALTAEANAAALGQVEIINRLLTLNLEQIEETLDDDEES